MTTRSVVSYKRTEETMTEQGELAQVLQAVLEDRHLQEERGGAQEK